MPCGFAKKLLGVGMRGGSSDGLGSFRHYGQSVCLLVQMSARPELATRGTSGKSSGECAGARVAVRSVQKDHETAISDLEQELLRVSQKRTSLITRWQWWVESQRQAAALELSTKHEFKWASDLVKEVDWLVMRGQADIHIYTYIDIKFKHLTDAIVTLRNMR